jgi:hypothetical protein
MTTERLLVITRRRTPVLRMPMIRQRAMPLAADRGEDDIVVRDRVRHHVEVKRIARDDARGWFEATGARDGA